MVVAWWSVGREGTGSGETLDSRRRLAGYRDTYKRRDEARGVGLK